MILPQQFTMKMKMQERRQKIRFEIRQQHIEEYKRLKRVQLVQNNPPCNPTSQKLYEEILGNPQRAVKEAGWIQLFREAAASQIAHRFRSNMGIFLKRVFQCYELIEQNEITLSLWVEAIGVIYYVADSANLNPDVTFEVIKRMQNMINSFIDSHDYKDIGFKAFAVLNNISNTNDSKIHRMMDRLYMLDFISSRLEHPCSTLEKQNILGLYFNILHFKFSSILDQEGQESEERPCDPYYVNILLELSEWQNSFSILARTIGVAYLITTNCEKLCQNSRVELSDSIMNILNNCRMYADAGNLTLNGIEEECQPQNQEEHEDTPNAEVQNLIEVFLLKFGPQLLDYQLNLISTLLERLLTEENLTGSKRRNPVLRSCSYMIQLYDAQNQDYELFSLTLISRVFDLLDEGYQQMDQYEILYFLSTLLGNEHYRQEIFAKTENKSNKRRQAILWAIIEIVSLEQSCEIVQEFLNVVQKLDSQVIWNGFHDIVFQKLEGCVYHKNQEVCKRATALLQRLQQNRSNVVEQNI